MARANTSEAIAPKVAMTTRTVRVSGFMGNAIMIRLLVCRDFARIARDAAVIVQGTETPSPTLQEAEKESSAAVNVADRILREWFFAEWNDGGNASSVGSVISCKE